MKKELSKIDNFHRDPREGYRAYFFSLTHSEMSDILARTFLMSSNDDRKLHFANLSGSVVDIYGSITWKFDSYDWKNFRDLILKERKTTEYLKNPGACDVSIIDSAYGYEIRVDIPTTSEAPAIPGGLFVDCWNGESEERVINEDTDEDMVNSPKHYKNGGIETIDLIEMYLSPEEFIGYLKGTVLKYRERAPYKGAMNTDYEKAYKFWTWLLEKKTTETTKDRYLTVKAAINSVYGKPERTIDGYYECPECGRSLTKNVKMPSGEIYVEHFNYCPYCGAAIIWED